MHPLLITFLALPSFASDPDPLLGQELYDNSCAACHGADGEGASALRAVNVRPRDLGGRWVTKADDGYLEGVIRDGGTSVGRSPLMPAWGRVMSDEDIANLAAFVRQLASDVEEPSMAIADSSEGR